MLISGSLTGVIKVLAACASISGRASHSLGVVCVSKLTPIKRPGRSTDYRDSVAQDGFTRAHFDETRFTSSFANHIQQDFIPSHQTDSDSLSTLPKHQETVSAKITAYHQTLSGHQFEPARSCLISCVWSGLGGAPPHPRGVPPVLEL